MYVSSMYTFEENLLFALYPLANNFMLKLIIDFDCENYGHHPSSCTISRNFEWLMTVDVSSDSNCGPNVKFASDALG